MAIRNKTQGSRSIEDRLFVNIVASCETLWIELLHHQPTRTVYPKTLRVSVSLREISGIPNVMFMHRLCRLAILALLALVFAGPAFAQDAPKINFDEHIRPIFREHCFSCHNLDKAKADLAVDSFAGLMKGGASGQVVVPGDLDASRLWSLVSHKESPQMPPGQDKLAEKKLNLIRDWILGGALENSGSTAKIAKRPSIDLKASAGGKKPEGPPPMPEPGKLSRQPPITTARAAASTALAASPWAPLVAVAGQKQVSLYHSDSRELLGVLPFPEGTPHVLKFSRSGSLLLVGGGRGASQGLVKVFDVKTGELVFQVGDELDAVLAADINENHTLIALAGPQKVVRVYSTADGALAYDLRKHTDWVYAIEFSPDGVLLATADRSGGMFVWESDTGREYQNLKGHTGPITDISWRVDSNLLASASEDTTIRLWELENGGQVKGWGAHGGGAWSVDFLPDGRLVSFGRDRQAKLWDGNGGQQRAFDAMNDIGLEVAATHDMARLIAGDFSGEIRVWNMADGKLEGNLAANPPTLQARAAELAPRLAQAEQAAQQGTTELAALQQAATSAAAAAKAAAEKAAASNADADKAEAQKAAEAQAAADKAVADKSAAVKPLQDAAAALAAESARLQQEIATIK